MVQQNQKIRIQVSAAHVAIVNMCSLFYLFATRQSPPQQLVSNNNTIMT